MPLLSSLARLFLLSRLFGGRHRPARGYGYRRGYGRRRHGRGGGFGMFGPFPTYSTRTRRGARVSVGGCCLPIPLTLGVVAALLGRLAARR